MIPELLATFKNVRGWNLSEYHTIPLCIKQLTENPGEKVKIVTALKKIYSNQGQTAENLPSVVPMTSVVGVPCGFVAAAAVARGDILFAPASSQQLLHGVGRVLASARQPLRRQRRPVVDHGDDPPRSLVLHQDVDELPRGHLARDLGEAIRRIELPLHVEADPGPLGTVVRVGVLGVLDEVPASLPVAAVVLPVKLKGGSVFQGYLGIPLNDFGGTIEDTIGTHFGRNQLLTDKVGTRTSKAKDSRPHGETTGSRDLLAGRQDNLLGVFATIVFGRILLGLAAQGSQPRR